MKRIFVDGQIILDGSVEPDIAVVCEEGIITHVGKIPKRIGKDVEVVELDGKFLSPGFIDIHVHGGLGHDFMDGTVEAIQLGCHAHLRHGVTTIFPTSTTGQPAQVMSMLKAVKGTIRKRSHPNPIPRIAGVHLYGPYFAPEKAGCHNKKGCRNPTKKETNAYFRTGVIRIATCAAELPGAVAFYKTARQHNCLITCGHSNASWSEMTIAFEHGMRHVDHFWCAMSSVPSVRTRFGTPMQGSMAEFVLANPEMSTEIIADGCHLSGELLQFAWQMKSSKRLCLVSDCNRALDMPPGRYAFGDMEDAQWLVSDGKVGRGSNGALASSVMGMDTMVQTMRRLTSVPLHEIVRMASLTPAERTGISDSFGSIAFGKAADLLILTNQLEVHSVFIGGECVLTKD